LGREKATGPVVAAIIRRKTGERVPPPPNWKPRLWNGPQNHRLLDVAIGLHVYYQQSLGPFVVSPDGERLTMREVALRLGREQLRTGLGVAHGSVELWTPAPHAELTLDPTVAIPLEAHRAGDEELRDVWLDVLGHWRGLCHFGASPDGQIALPGTRFWKVKGAWTPPTEEDGLHHLQEGETLSQVWDAFYRQLEGLPQRKNDGKEGTPPHVVAMPSFQGVAKLLEAGLEIERAQSVPMLAEYHFERRSTVDFAISLPWHGHAPALRSWLDVTALADRGAIHSLAPAVQAIWREPGRHAVAFAPRRIPDGWQT
jgi:hypothetical protein